MIIYVQCFIDQAKRKQEKKEAIRVLSELRTVLAVKAVETKERERQALLRQNPQLTEEQLDGSTAQPPHAQAPDISDNEPSSACSKTKENVQTWTTGNEELSKAEQSEDNATSEELGYTCIGEGDLGDNTQAECNDGVAQDRLQSLKDRFRTGNFLFASDVAAMAAARGRQMAAQGEETFVGDSEDFCQESSTSDEEEEDVVGEGVKE